MKQTGNLLVGSLLFAFIYFFSLSQVGLSMADTCLVLRCYFRTANHTSMSLPLRFFVFKVLGRIVGVNNSSNICTPKRHGRIRLASSHFSSTSVKPKAKDLKTPQHVAPRSCNDDLIVRRLGSIVNIMEERVASEKQIEEWQEAAVILDKFFFWLFITVAVAGTLVVFLQKPSAQ